MTDTTRQEAAAPLVPCPFCGGDVRLDVRYGPSYDLWDLYIVRCFGCFTETQVLRVHRNDPRDAKAEAQAKWNRRTPAPDGWQPIETAPSNGVTVLTQHQDDLFPVCAFQIEGEWMRETEGPEDEPGAGKWGPLYRKPTHWMPLPQPPAEGEGR